MKKYKEFRMFLNGKMKHMSKVIGYCKLHSCYLDKNTIQRKDCLYCKHYTES